MKWLLVTLFAIVFGEQNESVPADPTLSTTVLSNNEFALDFLKLLSSSKGKNIFFSPLSLSTAVAMTSLGARGNTLKEIDHAFHFDEAKKTSSDPMALHEIFRGFTSLYQKENPDYSLAIANRLFSQKGQALISTFLEDTHEYYKASIQQVDFGSGQAEEIINQWVAKQTHDKIQDLFKPGVLTKDTVLTLVNAIYFKGTWKTQFDKDFTHDMDFKMSTGETKSVQMMSTTHEYPYTEDEQLQVLEMPYAGDDISMVVFLPAQGGLEEFVSNLNAAKLHSLLKKLFPVKVNVKIPKFTLKTEYSLKETFKHLGVRDLFSEKCNISGIFLDYKDKSASEVVHSAFIQTDEEGTEAAAATGITFLTRSRARYPESFIADHPFLFAIRDKRNGLLLFLGLIENF